MKWFRWLCLVSLLLMGRTGIEAGENGPDSAATLREQFDQKKSDVERLKRMFRALNEVDSVYRWQYPAWTVLDKDIGERIRRSFRLRKIDVPATADITVIANPDAGEILEISIGHARMGRIETRSFLSDSLHAAILGADYIRRMIEPAKREQRFGQLYGAHPRFAAAYGSAFGAGLLLANGWGAEAKMGFEEIGYHFWSTGSVRGLAVFDELKIGVVIPIALGTSSAVNQPLDIRPRKMTGAIGFASEYTLPLTGQSITALISVADIPRITNLRLLADSSSFFFVHTVAQATYSRGFDLSPGQQLTLTGGVGYHQVASGELQPNKRVQTTGKEDFKSPVLRVEYVNRVANMFGVSAQIYSSIVFLQGWVEIVRNLLYLDLRYYSPVFREPRPWEQPYFFMISPRIQVIF